MKTKQILIGAYFVIALGYAIWQTYFGSAQSGFFANLGSGIVWPAIMFPMLGKIVGGIIIAVFVLAVVAS